MRHELRGLVLFSTLLAAAPGLGASGASATETACHRAWVTNWQTHTVARLDVDTGSYGETVDLGGAPKGIAVTPDGSTVVVALPQDGTVAVVDVASHTTTSIPVLEAPFHIAVTPDGARAYVTSQAVNDGYVTPIDLATRTAGSPIAVPGAGAIAITPDGRLALVGEPNGVVPVDLTTNTAGPSISLPEGPAGIAVTPDGTTALMTLWDGDQLQPLVLATRTLAPPIGIPSPFGVAVTPDGTTAVVSTIAPATAVAVDLATASVRGTVTLPKGPDDTIADQVAVSADGAVALVGNSNSNETFPVALPSLALGDSMSNGPYSPPTSPLSLAFDLSCGSRVPPTTAAPTTAVPTTPVPVPAVRTVIAPPFAG